MRIAVGGIALILFRAVFAALLTPAVFPAADSLLEPRFDLLLFAFQSVWGDGTSSTVPTGIRMAASIFTAAAGLVLAIICQDQLLAFASLLPGITWFCCCAAPSVTAQDVTEAARSFEATFQELVRRGVLTATAQVNQPHSAEEAAGDA